MSTLDDVLRRMSQEYMSKKLRKQKQDELNRTRGGTNYPSQDSQRNDLRSNRSLMNSGDHDIHHSNDLSPRMLSMLESSPFMHDFGKIEEKEKDFSSGFANNSQQSQLSESEFENSHQPI